MKSFKELKVWQKGIELVAMVYKITASFPEEEKYSNCSKSCGFQAIKCRMQIEKCKITLEKNNSFFGKAFFLKERFILSNL